MTAPKTRRAFLTIGLGGLAGLVVCTSRSKPSQSTPLGGSDDSGGSGHTGGDSAQDSGGSADTAVGGLDSGVDTGPVVCSETSDNIEGPFWIPGVPIRTEYDLYGHTGTSLTISGLVTDLSCTPLPDAIVEIWHANPDGGYDNSSPEMRYRGQMAVDDEGRYAFHTLKPGWYLNGSSFRPSHVHVKIWVEGRELKTTQLYFEGDPHIEGDPFVVEDLILPLTEDASGGLSGTYDFAVEV